MTAFPRAGSGPVLITVASEWRPLAAEAGWSVAERARIPAEPWSLDGCVVVTDDAAEAAFVLVRGGAVAPTAVGPQGVDADLVADAQRIGATLWPDDAGAPAAPEPAPVDEDTDVLLRALVTGSSVAAAARQAHMSVRTAQRRLFALRSRYGVATTAGVVAAWARDDRVRRQEQPA